jgi:hypothetical protein
LFLSHGQVFPNWVQQFSEIYSSKSISDPGEDSERLLKSEDGKTLDKSRYLTLPCIIWVLLFGERRNNIGCVCLSVTVYRIYHVLGGSQSHFRISWYRLITHGKGVPITSNVIQGLDNEVNYQSKLILYALNLRRRRTLPG